MWQTAERSSLGGVSNIINRMQENTRQRSLITEITQVFDHLARTPECDRRKVQFGWSVSITLCRIDTRGNWPVHIQYTIYNIQYTIYNTHNNIQYTIYMHPLLSTCLDQEWHTLLLAQESSLGIQSVLWHYVYQMACLYHFTSALSSTDATLTLPPGIDVPKWCFISPSDHDCLQCHCQFLLLLLLSAEILNVTVTSHFTAPALISLMPPL